MLEKAISERNLQPMRVQEVKKIAVVMGKAMGDFIVTLPAILALKQTYPDAELVFIGRPWVNDLLHGRQLPIDRMIELPVSPGIRDEKDAEGNLKQGNSEELKLFFGAMRKESFDLAIHLQGDGKSLNSFINQFGAGLTVGMRNEGAAKIDRSIPYIHYQNEVARNLEIVSLVGASTSEINPRVPVLEADVLEAKEILKQLSGGDYVVIHSGSNDIRRNWPPEKFSQTANAIIDKNFSIVLTGSEQEKEIVELVLSGVAGKEKVVNAVGKLTLRGLAGVLSLAALVVSNDTGPLHLARAVGAPSVGIYNILNLLNWGPLTRDKNRAVFSTTVHCPLCGLAVGDPWPFEPASEKCAHNASFVASVEVSRVLKEAFDLLSYS